MLSQHLHVHLSTYACRHVHICHSHTYISPLSLRRRTAACQPSLSQSYEMQMPPFMTVIDTHILPPHHFRAEGAHNLHPAFPAAPPGVPDPECTSLILSLAAKVAKLGLCCPAPGPCKPAASTAPLLALLLPATGRLVFDPLMELMLECRLLPG